MMLSRKWTLAAVAAMVIAVAGCSSSGDKKVADTTTEPDPEKVAGLFATAQDARSKADGASEAAAQAVKDANKYSTMFTTKAVHGVSAKAVANARMVLDARDAAAKAVTDAKAAKGSAEGAKSEAGKLSADNPNKASLVAALDAAIKAAEDAIKAAEDSQKHADLKTAVAAVEGTDKKKPKTPADHGEMVAKAIAGALEKNAGGGTKVMHKTTSGDSARPSSDKSHVMGDDHTGMTWAEIFGADNVRQERLGNQRTFIDVGPVTGMKATELGVRPTADLDEGETIEVDISYKGIPGSVFCLRDKCKVEDGKLTGAWVFAPREAEVYYEKVGDATDYMPEKNYARFGHWLVVGDNGDAILNTYAWSNGGTDVNLLENRELEGTASYSGSAVGLSVHKVFGSDQTPKPTSTSSGRFTANVDLEARFDDSPTVEGTVSNFQGDAVDPTWEVTLTELPLATSRQQSAGTTKTGGSGDNDGQWNAQAYGMKDKRPTGIFGDFNAHWTNGHAAGAFATRKD